MIHTFLAANTGSGFYSLFSEMTKRTDHTVYLIKGGPGTGKSTLMKKVAHAAIDRGHECEYIHCSSDPDSLDGIYLPDIKLIMLDATSPHTEDPRYPGAVEQIIPLGEYWDREILRQRKADIISLTDRISAKFRSVYNLLSAEKETEEMRQKILLSAYKQDKAEAMILKQFKRLALVKQRKASALSHRLISAVSGTGQVLYQDVIRQCNEIIMIDDNYHFAHHLIQIADRLAEGLGYNRLRLLCPLTPERIDHLILPECSLALISKGDLPWREDLPITKTLSVRSVLDPDILSRHKNKLSFVKKMRKALNDEVCDILKSEKALHDELEQIYIKAMDFDAVERIAERIITEHLN